MNYTIFAVALVAVVAIVTMVFMVGRFWKSKSNSPVLVSGGSKLPPKNNGWLIILITVVVMALIGVVLGFVPAITLDETVIFSVAWAWIFLCLGYLGASFQWWNVIGPDRVGVRLLFGKPIGIVTSGLPVVLPGIMTIVTFPTKVQQREFPAEPENIWRNDDDSVPVAEGKKPPLRMTFTESITDEEARDLFGLGNDGEYEKSLPGDGSIKFLAKVPVDSLSLTRVTAEVTPVVRWRITDTVAFVKIFGDESGIDEVNRQIEDEMASVLGRICPLISSAQFNQNTKWISVILFQAVERRIGAVDGHSEAWGIDLEAAFVKPIQFHHKLNKSIASVTEAGFNAATTIKDAEALKQKLIKEGEGAAEAASELERQTLIGKGRGIAAAVEATKLSAEQIIAAETAQVIGKGDGTIIVGADGVSQLMGIVKALQPKK